MGLKNSSLAWKNNIFTGDPESLLKVYSVTVGIQIWIAYNHTNVNRDQCCWMCLRPAAIVHLGLTGNTILRCFTCPVWLLTAGGWISELSGEGWRISESRPRLGSLHWKPAVLLNWILEYRWVSMFAVRMFNVPDNHCSLIQTLSNCASIILTSWELGLWNWKQQFAIWTQDLYFSIMNFLQSFNLSVRSYLSTFSTSTPPQVFLLFCPPCVYKPTCIWYKLMQFHTFTPKVTFVTTVLWWQQLCGCW